MFSFIKNPFKKCRQSLLDIVLTDIYGNIVFVLLPVIDIDLLVARKMVCKINQIKSYRQF